MYGNLESAQTHLAEAERLAKGLPNDERRATLYVQIAIANALMCTAACHQSYSQDERVSPEEDGFGGDEYPPLPEGSAAGEFAKGEEKRLNRANADSIDSVSGPVPADNAPQDGEPTPVNVKGENAEAPKAEPKEDAKRTAAKITVKDAAEPEKAKKAKSE
jgi:hypothetical protein